MKVNFKSSQGKWLLRALFLDVIRNLGNSVYSHDYSTDAPYWLNNNLDNDSRPVLRHEFIKLRDPTGVKFANKWLGGWQHLKALQESKWFAETWAEWQEELYQTDKMERLEKIREIAESTEPQAFQAAKYLANREYESTPSKRGRPSKEEISGNLKNEIRQLTQLEEDNQRMTGTLTLIQGGKN